MRRGYGWMRQVGRLRSVEGGAGLLVWPIVLRAGKSFESRQAIPLNRTEVNRFVAVSEFSTWAWNDDGWI